MSRNESPPPAELVEKLLATGPGAPDQASKLAIIRTLLGWPPPLSEAVVAELVKQLERQYAGLTRAQALTDELRLKLEELVGRVWIPAIFRGHAAPQAGAEPAAGETQEAQERPERPERRVFVQVGSVGERVVGLSPDVPAESLSMGCEVMLNRDVTAVVALSDRPFPPTRDVATVAETTSHGTVLVHRGDEEIEVQLAENMRDVELAPGDRIRWNASAAIAYGKVEKTATPRFLIGEVPDVPLEGVGGQDDNLAKLLSVLSTGLLSPQLARDYALSNRCSLLLTGPSGCGKTRMVQAALTDISRQSGRGVRIFVVKPGELEHWLVGSSEHNVRALFASLRDAANEGSLVVLFLDEAESIGRSRGHLQGFHSDKLLNALLAEIDGFVGRDGVAIVATTNREDLMDPALLSRLSDYVLHVGRPDAAAARAILDIHMPAEGVPYSPNGSMAMDTRSQVIETAVALLYGPTGPYAEVSRIKFRDGKSRVVSMRDLVSGRLLEQTCRAARQYALERERRSRERGVTVADMERAVADTVAKIAGSLTLYNVRAQMSELPTDVEIVAVERVLKRVPHPHRYVISPAGAADPAGPADPISREVQHA